METGLCTKFFTSFNDKMKICATVPSTYIQFLKHSQGETGIKSINNTILESITDRNTTRNSELVHSLVNYKIKV